MTKLLVCGRGSGALVMAGMASLDKKLETRVLSLTTSGRESMLDNGFIMKMHEKHNKYTTLAAKVFVFRNAEEALDGVDLIVLVMPAFSHKRYLEALKPHLKPGMTIIGLPGQAGFAFQIRHILMDIYKHITVMSFDTLPWVCRLAEYGVKVFSFKDSIRGAVDYGSLIPKADPISMVQNILGQKPKLVISGSLIGLSLGMNFHACIMYSKWHNWEGKPLPTKPLFYQGISEEGAKLLHEASQEVLDTARYIMNKHSCFDLSNIIHAYDWFMYCYSDDIHDKSSLYTCLTTNRAYDCLVHPMKQNEDGMYIPDFSHRYLMEDIPCGLVVIRAVATVAGYPTPNLDKIINWAQGVMGKEYLVDGQLKGKDLAATRSPQSYGLNTLDAMLGL